jgi:hypothetical protein
MRVVIEKKLMSFLFCENCFFSSSLAKQSYSIRDEARTEGTEEERSGTMIARARDAASFGRREKKTEAESVSSPRQDIKCQKSSGSAALPKK